MDLVENTSEDTAARAGDWMKVHRVLAEYCHAIDEARFADLEPLFAEDAVLTARLAGTVYRGPSEIRSYLEAQPPGMRGLHITVNPDIVIDGDEATVRADFVVVVLRGASSVVGAWGWYRDRLSYTGGRWLFRERRIETQFRLTDVEIAR